MFCNKCGFENNNEANFCENCGNQLNSASKKGKSNKGNKPNRTKYKRDNNKQTFSIKSLWVVAIAVIAGFFIYSIIDTNSSRNYNQTIPTNSYAPGNSVVEAKVFEIASKFVCGCGGCDEDSLELCDCNYANQEKQFIRNMVQNSTDDKIIINTVEDKYGGLKSDISVDNSIKSSPINVPVNEISLASTYDDRIKIYSHFECPCGQCGMDELKECTCDHPNGAVEVKGFIDSQIALIQYSVDEIVSQVAQKYGGKKSF